MNMACREQPGLRRDESLRFAWTIQESHACKQVQAGQLTVHTKLESVLVFWRESVMPLVQGIHMDPK